MWKHMARIISDVRPSYVFVENSPMLTRRGLGTVIGDLAELGYDAEWGVISAADVGAKHLRKRIWIVARQCEVFSHSDNRIKRREQQPEGNGQAQRNMANADNRNRGRKRGGIGNTKDCQAKWDLHPIFNQPEPVRVADGVAARVDRLKAIGNGQVPQVAAVAWRVLSERLNDNS
jgi:DNA (cytosine-5)-methyltransferase 1